MPEDLRAGRDNARGDIDRLRATHVAALNASDAAGWTATFAEDAVQLPPIGPINTGIAAIGAFNERFLAMFTVSSFNLTPMDLQVHGDVAIEHGEYTIVLTPQGAPAGMSDSGKYITTYRRTEEGVWLISRDGWTSTSARLPTRERTHRLARRCRKAKVGRARAWRRLQSAMLFDLSDADVASRAAAGDTEAEAEVCRRMAPRLRLYGMRHLRSGAAADDLVQQVLLVTLEALHAGKLRDYAKLPHFVLGMARTTVSNCAEARGVAPRCSRPMA